MPINLYTKTLLFVEADAKKSSRVALILTCVKSIFQSQIVPNYAMAQHAWKWKGNEKLKLFMNTLDTLQFAKRLVFLTCTMDVVAPCFDQLATKTPFFCRTLKVLECVTTKRSENDLLITLVLSHIKKMTSLESLNLFGVVNDAVVERLKDIASPNFQSLNLSDCKSLTDKGLESLKSLPFLKVLNLNENSQITNATLSHIHCMRDSLQSLSLSHCDQITNDGLVFLKEFSALQSLSLDYCGEISGSGLANLFSSSASSPSKQDADESASYCSTVAHQNNNNNSNNYSKKFQRRLATATTTLGGSQSMMITTGSSASSETSVLSSLHGGGGGDEGSTTSLNSVNDAVQRNQNQNNNNDSPLPPIGSGLKTLSLCSCTKIDDEALAFIGKRLHASLTTLSLAFCTNITSKGIAENFHRMRHVENLDCRYCEQVGDEQSLKTIGQNMTSLKALNLYKCLGVSDGGLDHLKNLPQLQYLNISKCHLVTDAGVCNLIRRNHQNNHHHHRQRATKKNKKNENDDVKDKDDNESDVDDPPTENPAVTIQQTQSATTHQHQHHHLHHSHFVFDRNHTSPLTSSLLILHVSDCKNLTDITMSLLHNLASLRFLNIVYCDKISQSAKDSLEQTNPRLNISHSIVPNQMQTMLIGMMNPGAGGGSTNNNHNNSSRREMTVM